MLSAIRKNQHWLTFLIVVLTIISFIWLYNRTNLSQVGVNDVASIYGRVLQRADIEREVRDYRLAMALGFTDLVRDMGGFADNEEVAVSSFIFNILVLQHEASLLHIVPPEKAIAAEIQNLPVFQTEGVFDSTKYARMMNQEFASRGFTEQQLEKVVRDSLCLKKLRELIVSPVLVSEAQLREAARIYQPVEAQVLFFNRAFYISDKQNNEVTAEEKKSFYEKNQKTFVSEEERAASYIIATLPPEQQKLEAKERVHAMQELADHLAALKQKSQETPDDTKAFEKAAAEKGLHVVSTQNFNNKGEEALSSSQKKEVKNHPKIIPQEVIDAAFKLSKIGEVSEVIQKGSSFYLVTLTQQIPSKQLSFSQAEKTIEQLLQEQKALQRMSEAATKSMQKIRETMNSGKKFSEAVTLAGCKAESLPASISPEKVGALTQFSPQQKQALLATLPLQPGEFGELKHAPWGDFAVYLHERAPLTGADWDAHRRQIEEGFLQQEREILFFEWMRKARLNANITMLSGQHRRSLLQRVFGR